MEPSRSDVIGGRLIEVLTRAWNGGFSTKSDFARSHATNLAMACSDGFITTRLSRTTYGNRWLITPDGLNFLWKKIGK